MTVGTRTKKRTENARRAGYSKQFKVLLRGLAALAVVSGVLIWFLVRSLTQPEKHTKLVVSAVSESAPQAGARIEPVEPSPPAPPEPAPHRLMQAGAHDKSEHEPRHPHPITPKRRRIYRENNLVGAMNRAMDLGRFEELRELNGEYRKQYPEDEHVLQEAYEIIADCQEELTDERFQRAKQFWKKRRSSQLRRHVRRHCKLDA